MTARKKIIIDVPVPKIKEAISIRKYSEENLINKWVELSNYSGYEGDKLHILIANCYRDTPHLGLIIYGVTDKGDLASMVRLPSTTMVRELDPREIRTKGAGTLIKMLPYIPLAGCTIGTDPEVFVMNEKGVIPAFKFLPRQDETARNTPFWDGFQAEFTCYPGDRGNDTCVAYTVDEIQAGLQKLYTKAIEYDKTSYIAPITVIDIDIPKFHGEDPEYLALGCAPSYNVYGTPPLKVDDPTVLPIRFAGCHMHFGIKKTLGSRYKERLPNIVKMIDAIFGVASVSLLQGLEDPRRRMFYGKAGEYRTPPWGLEYRVPSSAILAHPTLTHISFELARVAVYLGLYFDIDDILIDATAKKVENIINSYNVNEAVNLLTKNWEIISTLLSRKVSTVKTRHIYNAIKYGITKVLPIHNMAEDWKLIGPHYHHIRDRWTRHCSTTSCCIANTTFIESSIITNTKQI